MLDIFNIEKGRKIAWRYRMEIQGTGGVRQALEMVWCAAGASAQHGLWRIAQELVSHHILNTYYGQSIAHSQWHQHEGKKLGKLSWVACWAFLVSQNVLRDCRAHREFHFKCKFPLNCMLMRFVKIVMFAGPNNLCIIITQIFLFFSGANFKVERWLISFNNIAMEPFLMDT